MTDKEILERLRRASKLFNPECHEAVSEIETLRGQRDKLLEDLQDIASVAYRGGLAELNGDDVLMAIRHRTRVYFRKDASDDTHREAIASVKGEQP